MLSLRFTLPKTNTCTTEDLPHLAQPCFGISYVSERRQHMFRPEMGPGCCFALHTKNKHTHAHEQKNVKCNTSLTL